MNWITRYVQAVVDQLPKKDQNGVSEELTSLLEEEAYAHFDAPVSQVSDEELRKWIEEKDHPPIAAVAYLPKHNLIEESAYPLYWSTVKIMMIVMEVFWIVRQIACTTAAKSITVNVIGNVISYTHCPRRICNRHIGIPFRISKYKCKRMVSKPGCF